MSSLVIKDNIPCLNACGVLLNTVKYPVNKRKYHLTAGGSTPHFPVKKGPNEYQWEITKNRLADLELGPKLDE